MAQSATTTYSSNISYAPQGPISGMQLGNGLWETTNFNSLQQPVNMFLGSTQGGYDIWKLVNAYGVAGKNNGNITQQTMNASGMAATITQDYTYDGVNRLLLAAEYTNGTATPSCPDTTSQWCTQFGYDAYGNRSVANATNYSLKFGLEARACGWCRRCGERQSSGSRL